MSKKLTVAEIENKIRNIENTIYNGHKADEMELKNYLHPVDWLQWCRYQKLLKKRKEEAWSIGSLMSLENQIKSKT